MSRAPRTLIALAALLPFAAQAHTGHDMHAGVMEGVMHPLTGWDHLAVLLSLGLLAGHQGTRLVAACGALLVAALGGGASLGLALPTATFVEPAILVTVMASVLLLSVRRRLSAALLLSLSMAFAFIHGIAHGQEAPAGNLAGYFTGFALAGVGLYAAGVLMGRCLARQKGVPITSRQPGKSPASR